MSPQAGHEQAGRRPAIAISPLTYNRRVGLAVFCPITKQRKGYPFEVELYHGGQVEGVILADQLKSLDWRARRAERIEAAPRAILAEVLAKVRALLAS